MKLMLSFRSILGALTLLLATCGLSSIQAAEGNPSVYAQLSSSKTQVSKEPQLVAMGNEDGISGIDHPSPEKVVIKQSGNYFLMVAGQIGADKSAKEAGGYVDMWLVQNGKVVENSGVRQFVEQKDSTSVLIFQGVTALKAGDTISIGYAASKPSLGLIFTPAPAKESAIASIVFSLFKL